MAEAVPRIWTLKKEARGLPIPSAADIESVAILRNVLPQGENKLPWYAFCDEAIKLKKSLVAQKKKGPQPLARNSSDEGLRHQSAPSPVETVVARPPVVTLDSSTTISDQDMGCQMETTDRRLSLWQELSIPFPSPVQQTAVEEEIIPLREKVVQEAPLGEAGPSIPRLPKYSSLYLAKPYSIPNMEVTSDSPWGPRKFHFHLTKLILSKELAAPYSDLVDPYAAFAQTAKHFNQTRLDELERVRLEEVVKAFEAVAQVKRNADLALASTVVKAESARIHFANSTLLSFLYSPAYEKKVGSECATYLHSIVASTQGRFPDLATRFNEEVTRRPDWYRGLTLPIPKGAVLLEEGGETPNPPPEENPL
ncbi:hypothetical protein LIER_32686 [Lithospermum erythrorhizon]|uniref:Uncharacterized protein n=1 Tax=Lithospermum erythrorhizon TaxID=34254 RepID=A0AAV3RUI4_LITER